MIDTLKKNLYAETYYETSRKGKMYLKNDPTTVVGVADLIDLLKGISVSTVQIRFFYTRFTTDGSMDLLTNYPEKLLTSILIDTLVQNLPLTIRNVFSDHNTFIFDICCSADDPTIRSVLRLVLCHEATSFVSKVEIHTTGDQEELFFCLQGRNNLDYFQTILPKDEPYDVIPALRRELPVTLDILDDYYQLLSSNYPIFYNDVKNRLCTIWCAQEGRGSYTIKRHVGGRKVIFAPTFDESEPLLQIERIVQIVPNSMAEGAEYPNEMVIDLDVPNSVSYDIVKQVSMSKKFRKKRRIKFRNGQKKSE